MRSIVFAMFAGRHSGTCDEQKSAAAHLNGAENNGRIQHSGPGPVNNPGPSMFENIIEQATDLIGDRKKASQLVGMLVALIFNEKRGGAGGFVQAFRNANLGHLVTSWLGNNIKIPISSNQLESVLGPALLGSMASRLALTQTTTMEATAKVLPEVVGALGHHGHMPTG